MKPAVRFCVILAVCSIVAAQSKPASDEVIWDEFVRWVEVLRPLPVGQNAVPSEVYVKALTQRAVPNEEAKRRWDRVSTILRRGSPEREKIFWNGVFKLGGGPSDPLRLLQESVRRVPAGKALDPGMGRGRNAIWLASLGWDVTGYDIAADALSIAQGYAKEAGVKIKTIESSHEKFDFGENQWDLIVCAYNFMDLTDPKWPPIIWRALKPSGLLVWQTGASDAPRFNSKTILEGWARFHLVRFEDLDPGVVDDDWTSTAPRPVRVMRLVVRKQP